MKLTKKHLLVILFSFSLLIILVTPILSSAFSTFGLGQVFSTKVTAQDTAQDTAQEKKEEKKPQKDAKTSTPTPLGTLKIIGEKGWGKTGDPGLLNIIGEIIKILLGLLGVIAVIFVVIGGFQWMTAGGNEEKIKGAKRVIGQGIVGLVIVLAAYAIAYFVIDQLARKFMTTVE